MFNICFNFNLLNIINKCLYYNVNNCFKPYKVFNKKISRLLFFLIIKQFAICKFVNIAIRKNVNCIILTNV